MENIKYILCHGSGNRFVMIDSVEQDLSELQNADFVQKVCRNTNTDGVLFINTHHSGHYAMRMFNTDGSEAEMCGNGMRCAARLVGERYTDEYTFDMASGDKLYAVCRVSDFDKLVKSYAVDIEIVTATKDFTLTDTRFVGKRIEALDTSLYFTYLNLGNPHIVAFCDDIDLDHLTQLGERVKQLPMIFPHGVNVSLAKYVDRQQIYVATYERGVGLTASCGTAMTASATASTLLGICREGETIDVRNRGGKVNCVVNLDGRIETKLVGNATFESVGLLNVEGEIVEQSPIVEEREAWANFVKGLE